MSTAVWRVTIDEFWGYRGVSKGTHAHLSLLCHQCVCMVAWYPCESLCMTPQASCWAAWVTAGPPWSASVSALMSPS